MAKKDARVDEYISKSAEFAQPVLNHLRSLVHKAIPDVEEKMKWSFPHFDYAGGTVFSIAAFKQHCTMTFWKASLMKDSDKVFYKGEKAMGQLGRITSLKDLPSDRILIKYIKEAAKLNEQGVKVPKVKSSDKKEIKIPGYLTSILKKNKKAEKVFKNFSYSHKKEYVEWFEEAKTEETRNKRLATAMEWMSEGKSRNWKYMKK